MSETAPRPDRRPDWPGAVAALAFLAVGGYAVAESLRMTPLGAVFPRTIGAVLLALSALQLARCLAGRPGGAALEEGERGGSVARRAALAAVVLAWALAFPVVGFVVASLAGAFALSFIAEFERISPLAHAVRVAVLLAMVGLFYWLMTAVLNIPMPRAWLF